MKYRLAWSPLALLHFEAIRKYLEEHFPSLAEAHLILIRTAANRLRESPLLGRHGRVNKTRELVVHRTPYLIAYRVIRQEIQILAILHGAQRWPDSF